MANNALAQLIRQTGKDLVAAVEEKNTDTVKNILANLSIFSTENSQEMVKAQIAGARIIALRENNNSMLNLLDSFKFEEPPIDDVFSYRHATIGALQQPSFTISTRETKDVKHESFNTLDLSI